MCVTFRRNHCKNQINHAMLNTGGWENCIPMNSQLKSTI